MGFLSGIFRGVGKFAKGAIGLVGKGVHEAEKVALNFSSLPGKALANNFKALGLDANTLLMIAAGFAAIMLISRPSPAIRR
jgi:hypothetical protein